MVDTHTRFKLGSISKSFTGLAVALLVVDGRLRLDAPVAQLLPGLRLKDPLHQRTLTLEHLLTHRSGLDLGALDLLLWPQPNQHKPADLLRALRSVARTGPAGKQFAYSNAAYVLAGEVVAQTAGMPYEQFVAQHIFQPLGMLGCGFGGWAVAPGDTGNLAQPHRLWQGKMQAVRTDDFGVGLATTPQQNDTVPVGLEAAAGGARCDADGLARWVQFVARGEVDSAALAATKTRLQQALALATQPRTWVQNDTGLGTSPADFTAARAGSAGSAARPRTAYGLGFELGWIDGQTRVFHHGGLAGIAATFAAWPAQGVGYAVAINTSGAATRDRLAGLLQASVLPLTKAAQPRIRELRLHSLDAMDTCQHCNSHFRA